MKRCELSAAGRAAIAARIAAEEGAAAARLRDYRTRVAAFPVSAIDERLAEAIDRPARVVSLDLRGQEGVCLTVVPPTIKKLTHLEVLRLEGNALTDLPAELGQLRSLRELHLAHNLLSELPRDLWYPKRLEVLNLHGNRLTEIFKHFGFHQRKGAELQVAGNPLASGSAIGSWPKLGVVGVDTETLFPIDRDYLLGEFPGQRQFPLTALHLYGRAPTAPELAELKQLFPRATVQHIARHEDGPLASSLPAPEARATPTKRTPRAKPSPLHPEQVAHQQHVFALAPRVSPATIEKLGRPCIELLARKATRKDLAPGATRIGGRPDLPPGSEWPCGGRGPMPFLAQLDLAAPAPYDPDHLLPASGLLSFFAGHYDEGTVLHTGATSELTPAVPPGRLFFGAAEEAPYPPCGVRLRGGISLPFHKDRRDEESGWFDLVTTYRKRGGKEPKHQILGHHFGDTESIEGSDVVLLALGSDDAANMNWGDAGVLYFVIDRKSLASRAWDRVRVTSTD